MLNGSIVEKTRPTESKAKIGSVVSTQESRCGLTIETRDNGIRPGFSTIKRDIRADVEQIEQRIKEEFRHADQMIGVGRIHSNPRLAAMVSARRAIYTGAGPICRPGEGRGTSLDVLDTGIAFRVGVCPGKRRSVEQK